MTNTDKHIIKEAMNLTEGQKVFLMETLLGKMLGYNPDKVDEIMQDIIEAKGLWV